MREDHEKDERSFEWETSPWNYIVGSAAFGAVGIYIILAPAPFVFFLHWAYLTAIPKLLLGTALIVTAILHLIDFKFPGVEKQFKWIGHGLFFTAILWESYSRGA